MFAATPPPGLPGLEPCHEIRLAGANIWSMLSAVAMTFAGEDARLDSVSGGKLVDGDCLLTLRIGGIEPDRAAQIAGILADHPQIRLSRIEHIVWRARS